MEQELKKIVEEIREVREIANLGKKEIDSLRYIVNKGLQELSGLMGAKTYRKKVVKPFINKIWSTVSVIIARAKSCFTEYKDRQGYQDKRYEELNRENNILREESRRLEYLLKRMYGEVIEMGKKEGKIKDKNR